MENNILNTAKNKFDILNNAQILISQASSMLSLNEFNAKQKAFNKLMQISILLNELEREIEND
jgi:hypothetical protein